MDSKQWVFALFAWIVRVTIWAVSKQKEIIHGQL